MSIAAIAGGALGFLKTPGGKWLALIGGVLLALYIAREQGIATGHEECQREALEAALAFEQSQRVIAEDAAVAGAERAAELEAHNGQLENIVDETRTALADADAACRRTIDDYDRLCRVNPGLCANGG